MHRLKCLLLDALLVILVIGSETFSANKVTLTHADLSGWNETAVVLVGLDDGSQRLWLGRVTSLRRLVITAIALGYLLETGIVYEEHRNTSSHDSNMTFNQQLQRFSFGPALVTIERY